MPIKGKIITPATDSAPPLRPGTPLLSISHLQSRNCFLLGTVDCPSRISARILGFLGSCRKDRSVYWLGSDWSVGRWGLGRF